MNKLSNKKTDLLKELEPELTVKNLSFEIVSFDRGASSQRTPQLINNSESRAVGNSGGRRPTWLAILWYIEVKNFKTLFILSASKVESNSGRGRDGRVSPARETRRDPAKSLVVRPNFGTDLATSR